MMLLPQVVLLEQVLPSQYNWFHINWFPLVIK